MQRTEGVSIRYCEMRKKKAKQRMRERKEKKIGRSKEKNAKTRVAIVFFFLPKPVTTGRVQKLQCHLLRLFHLQVSFHAFFSLCILITQLLCMPFVVIVQVNSNSVEQQLSFCVQPGSLLRQATRPDLLLPFFFPSPKIKRKKVCDIYDFLAYIYIYIYIYINK